MSRENLIHELSHYKSYNAEEEDFRLRMLRLLQNEADCFHRHLAHGHITASALILNREADQVLLLHHRKLDRWLQPGGHADGDENTARVAEKEAREETGLKSISLLQGKIYDLDIHLIPERKNEAAHLHYDIRYVFQAEPEEELQQNKESKAVAWVPVAEAPLRTGNDESISRMLRKIKMIKRKDLNID